jgi:hypothetical protein
MAKKSAKRTARPVEKAVLSFRVPAELRGALSAAALTDDRTVSSYVTRLLAQRMREAGYLK